MKLSGNVAFPTMLQSVLGLGSQEGGEGVHSRGNFCPQHPLRMARSGPPTFQELVADIFWKKPLMWFTFSPRQEIYSTIHL